MGWNLAFLRGFQRVFEKRHVRYSRRKRTPFVDALKRIQFFPSRPAANRGGFFISGAEMASQAGYFNVQEFADAGVPLVGGRLYTYAYGTTTQKTAYTDAAGLVAHTYTSDGAGGSYIALNSRGELPAPLYLVSGSYDLALKRSDGSTVWTRRADGADSLSLATSLSTVAGTNSITATLAGLTAYTTGQEFRFIAAGANTGAVTLNINSIGAIAVTRNGTTALAAGDIQSAAVVRVVYDGTQFQVSTLGEGTTGAALRLAATASASRVIVNAQAPGFSAYQTGAAQVFSAGVFNKVTLNAEIWDLTNAFDATTNSRFTPLVAGKYMITGCVVAVGASAMTAAIYKNGSLEKYGASINTNSAVSVNVSALVDMNGTTDYVELWGFSNATATIATGPNGGCFFQGFLV